LQAPLLRSAHGQEARAGGPALPAKHAKFQDSRQRRASVVGCQLWRSHTCSMCAKSCFGLDRQCQSIPARRQRARAPQCRGPPLFAERCLLAAATCGVGRFFPAQGGESRVDEESVAPGKRHIRCRTPARWHNRLMGRVSLQRAQTHPAAPATPTLRHVQCPCTRQRRSVQTT
jgi:hypothetical protein